MNNMMTESVRGTKRKRTQNTITEQYLLYIEEMENNYAFRSGTIDPTLDPDFLNKTWEQLVKLNFLGIGSALTKKMWQKRFKDWKNATRAKYRNMKEDRLVTGRGVAEKIELTEPEERGLELWGKVAVTGSPLVSITGEINKTHAQNTPETSKTSTENIFEINKTLTNDKPQTVEDIAYEYYTENDKDIKETNNISFNEKNVETNQTDASTNMHDYNKRRRAKPYKTSQNKHSSNLKDVAHELKISYDANQKTLQDISSNIANFAEKYYEVHSERNKLEEIRLQFEITAYTHKNKDFVYKMYEELLE